MSNFVWAQVNIWITASNENLGSLTLSLNDELLILSFFSFIHRCMKVVIMKILIIFIIIYPPGVTNVFFLHRSTKKSVGLCRTYRRHAGLWDCAWACADMVCGHGLWISATIPTLTFDPAHSHIGDWETSTVTNNNNDITSYSIFLIAWVVCILTAGWACGQNSIFSSLLYNIAIYDGRVMWDDIWCAIL